MGESDECNGIINVENSKDSKTWKTISSISDIQKQSRNWTLAGDAGLLEYLQGFSHQLISKTHEIEKNVDQLIHETKATASRVNNIINDFLMLSNTQFIENRVYDEEIQIESPPPANKQEEQKTKEQREAEIIPQISTALALGLEVIEKAFDQVELQGDSDSEDEEGRTIHGESLLEPKDPYLHRPLPHIIGSESFHNDDTVGLFDLVSNDVESASESDQKEYDSGGDSSEESFEEPLAVEKASEPFRNGLPNFEAPGDSDSSDMFGDEAEYVSGSADSEEYIKPAEPNDTKAQPLVDEEPEDDVSKDLFSDVFTSSKNEEKSAFLSNSPSKNSLFDDDNDFEDSVPEEKERLGTGKSIETISETTNVTERNTNTLKGKQVMIAKDLEALFQSGDDDLFAPKKVLEKAKTKDTKVERTKSISLFDDDDEDDGELFADPVTKPSVKPETFPNIPAEENEFEEPPIATKFFEESPVAAKPVLPHHDITSSFDSKSATKADNLFMDDSQDDLFDILDKTDKFHSSEIPSESLAKLPEATTPPKKDFKSKEVKEKKSTVLSLLDDDDDDDDLFSLPKKESKTKSILNTQTKARSGSSLFEDEDLFKKDTSDSPDVDLFATKSKPSINSKPEAIRTQNKLPDIVSDQSKQQPKVPVGGVSLFGNIDIFGKGKSPVEASVKSPVKTSVKTPMETSVKTDIFENTEEPTPLSKVEHASEVKSTEQISVSFDRPVDTSNTLNCAAKGRAKIQTRRRPPTRKGRQAVITSTVEKSETVDQVDSIFDDSLKSEYISVSVQHKEISVDTLTSPSTEEDDIFPMADPAARDIFSSVESKKDVSFTDSLFSNIGEKKPSNITDDIFDDDIFSAPVTKSIRAPVLYPYTDDIFSEEPAAKKQHSKQSDIFSESEDDIFSNQALEDDIFSNQALEDDIFSNQATVKPATTVTKKQPSIKQVKRESDIFDDPLLGFSNSAND